MPGSGASATDGHVYAAGGRTRRAGGTVVSQPFDHYSLLAGIESLFGLPALRHAGDAAALPI
jgi:hypothetical protein